MRIIPKNGIAHRVRAEKAAEWGRGKGVSADGKVNAGRFAVRVLSAREGEVAAETRRHSDFGHRTLPPTTPDVRRPKSGIFACEENLDPKILGSKSHAEAQRGGERRES